MTAQKLDQIAFLNRGKVKKPEAAQLIRLLAERYPDAVPELGKLLALHGPATVGKKDAFGWVAQAVAGPKELRKYLRYVMCDGKNAVATDGSLMLVAPMPTAAPGLYDPKTGMRVWELFETLADVPDAHPGKFPDWGRVALANRRDFQDVATVDLRAVALGNTPSLRNGPTGTAFQEGFWRLATQKCDRVSFGQVAHVDSIQFQNAEGFAAVLMPYRKNYLEKMGQPV